MKDSVTTSSWATFRRDLGTSADAWKRAPALPLLSAVLWVSSCAVWLGTEALPLLMLLGVVLGLFEAGFYGTQRIWYLRASHGDTLTRTEIWELSLAFLGRFVVLGVLMGLAAVPLVVVFLPFGGIDGNAPAFGGIASFILLDFFLTFVTPALAFTTRSVKAAVLIGLATIRQTWPASKWYALVPGLAFGAVRLIQPKSTTVTLTTVGISTLGGMLTLWFKGAIAAYYLRLHPETGLSGAAYDDQLKPRSPTADATASPIDSQREASPRGGRAADRPTSRLRAWVLGEQRRNTR